MTEAFSIAGKVCIVTGAFHGLGAVIARRFAGHGAKVVLTDVRDCSDLAAELDGLAVRCDVTDEEQVAAAMRTAVDRFGHIDVLINNAGVESWEGSIVDLDLDGWRRDMDINVLGVALGIKHAVPFMGVGTSIVNVASLFGLLPVPTLSSYDASKAAVIHLTKTAAVELGPRGIRVNAVCPTGLTHDSYLGRIEGVDNWLDDWLKLNHQHVDELGT
ncbi:MAG: SDR family oxidoreductase, partial [Acidimicrobiales bacterium]|nr:SDR family oxidoreductase [Acidimicrobiales bacterium]